MELCLITPAAHVEHTKLLPGRFCLANVKDDGYRRFFGASSDAGYEVILDNGVFEGELVSDEEYFKTISFLKPHVVVAPDLMNADAHVNFNRASDFATNVKSVIDTPELMFVPQCKQGNDASFNNVIIEAIRSGLFQWIGICRNACFNAFGQFTHTNDEDLNKFYFGAWAEQHGILTLAREKGVRFHLLGIGGDLSMLERLWWVDRADTASLFFQATQGQLVSADGILSENVSRPTDYFCRDFGHHTLWHDALIHNCYAAQIYATAAKRKRYEILKDRI